MHPFAVIGIGCSLYKSWQNSSKTFTFLGKMHDGQFFKPKYINISLNQFCFFGMRSGKNRTMFYNNFVVVVSNRPFSFIFFQSTFLNPHINFKHSILLEKVRFRSIFVIINDICFINFLRPRSLILRNVKPYLFSRKTMLTQVVEMSSLRCCISPDFTTLYTIL